MTKPEENNPMNSADAAGQAVSRGQRQGSEFTAPLGSVKSGRLIFASGASWVTVRADPSLADLYHARFEDRAPRVRAEDGTVTIRYPRFPLFDWLYYLRERPAEVTLNAQIPWDIEIRNGVSRLTADLRGLELHSFEVSGGEHVDVIAPPQGELFSETNDNSVAILLTYGTARVLLTARGQGRRRSSTWRKAPTRGLKRSSGFRSTKSPDLKFRAQLTEGASEMELALV